MSYGPLGGLHEGHLGMAVGSSSLHYMLVLPKLTLAISNVKVHETGLDLVVSLGFSNA